MIIAISTALHYLLMLMAGPAGGSRLRGDGGWPRVVGEKEKHGCVGDLESVRDSCWFRSSQTPLCGVMTQQEAWH